MKKSGWKIIRGGLFILLFLCMALPALPVKAGSGIGFGPPSIDITDAMRGFSYENSLTVFNLGNNGSNYSVTVEGEAAAWFSFNYQGKPFKQIEIPAGSNDHFEAIVNVPDDAANQDYSAKVTVTSSPTSSNGTMGVGLSLAAYCDFKIIVTGTQHIAGDVGGVFVEDQETGFPILFKVVFENTGNVVVAPSIDVSIDWNGTPVDSFNYDKTQIGPSKKDFIDIPWDTAGHTPGDYAAHVTVTLDGKQIYVQDLKFKILALGSLTRSGELRDVKVNGTLETGKIIKITGTFANTGSADVLARLIGEIYFNNTLVQMLEGGDAMMFNTGMQETLAAYFTPQQAGQYIVKAQVDFGGKKTDIKELTINIKAAPSGSVTGNQVNSNGSVTGNQGNSTSLLWPMIGGAALILIIAGGFMVMRKRKR